MKILENLYYGNVAPYDRDIPQKNEYKNLQKLVDRHEKVLKDTMTNNQQEYFNKFMDCFIELNGMNELDAFIHGYILATKIMTEIMESPE